MASGDESRRTILVVGHSRVGASREIRALVAELGGSYEVFELDDGSEPGTIRTGLSRHIYADATPQEIAEAVDSLLRGQTSDRDVIVLHHVDLIEATVSRVAEQAHLVEGELHVAIRDD